jgi:subfamily B ATP-binding cassette protein MsbA
MAQMKSISSNSPGVLQMVRRVFIDHGRQHTTAYIVALVLMAISAAATAKSVSLLRPVVDGMLKFDAAGEGGNFKELRYIAFMVAGLYLLRGLATFGQLVIMSRAGNNIVASVQAKVFDRLLHQPVGFFHDRHSSDLMSRLAFAASGVRDTIQVIITSAGRDLLTLMFLILVMVYQDGLMAVIALSVLPVAAVVLGRLIKRVRSAAHRSYDGSARIMGTMQETVQGIRIVKSFNLENVMRTRMAASIRQVEQAANRMAMGMAMSSPVGDTLGGLAVSFIIFYGGWRVTVAHSDPGSFFAFIAALLAAYEPAKRLGRFNIDMQNGLVGARLIYEILDRPAGEPKTDNLPPLAVREGRVVLDNVRFGYRPGERVLDGVSFTAEPSTTTALVGPSGGGKSTIISLIQRFYEPSSGTIIIDGQNINGVELRSLRAAIAFVSQDVFLFGGTIRDNIELGRLGATDDEIMVAARKANAHDFIMGFSAGYQTAVGEQGAQLSGGQRQRIAIARAILKDAPIILLDEPTAALDSESEREVQKALDDLRVGRTTLVVAHRLQTIVNSDRICVIEKGCAAESGTHDELISRRGSYYAFFAAQFGENIRTVMKADPAAASRAPPSRQDGSSGIAP